MSAGRSGRLCTFTPAAVAPAVSVFDFAMASCRYDSTWAGVTRLLQASWCIWRRLGRLPSLQALGNCLVPSRLTGPVATYYLVQEPGQFRPAVQGLFQFDLVRPARADQREQFRCQRFLADRLRTQEHGKRRPVPFPGGAAQYCRIGWTGPWRVRPRGSAATPGAFQFPRPRWHRWPVLLPLPPSLHFPIRSGRRSDRSADCRPISPRRAGRRQKSAGCRASAGNPPAASISHKTPR